MKKPQSSVSQTFISQYVVLCSSQGGGSMFLSRTLSCFIYKKNQRYFKSLKQISQRITGQFWKTEVAVLSDQKFRHFWMIIRDLFFESGSTEATKIKKILQRYVIYISDQITVPCLYTETGNRRLNIVDGMFSLEERG